MNYHLIQNFKIKHVYLAGTTVIPAKYKGATNKGNIYPENLKLRLPRIKYYFSEEFCYFMQDNIKNKWVAKLAKLNNTYIGEDDDLCVSFIDCIDDISVLPIKQIYNLYNEANKTGRYPTIENYFVYNKNILLTAGLKNKIKPGRFLRKLFPEITNTELEEFVNMFKAFKNKQDFGLEIIRGNDIVKYYNRANQVESSSGRLHNSCMNYTTETDQKYKNLHFYANVPNCGLLILKEKDSEKIRGRAFIWTSADNKTYVDCLYTVKESDNFIYKKYIAVNKCLSNTNGDSLTDFIVECPPEVQKLEHYMPYLDTLRYDKKRNVIVAQR